MKTRVAVLALLFVTALALLWVAQSSAASTTAIEANTPLETHRYLLTPLVWRVRGSAAGEGYTLVASEGPALQGNGCCCVYLPCILR